MFYYLDSAILHRTGILDPTFVTECFYSPASVGDKSPIYIKHLSRNLPLLPIWNNRRSRTTRRRKDAPCATTPEPPTRLRLRSADCVSLSVAALICDHSDFPTSIQLRFERANDKLSYLTMGKCCIYCMCRL